MTVQIYNCETLTIRPEMVQREKPDGTFYGLRLHMNTDQAITFWSGSVNGLQVMVAGLIATLREFPSSVQASPGQLSPH